VISLPIKSLRGKLEKQTADLSTPTSRDFLLILVGGSLGPEGRPAKRQPSPEGLG
jgi:hypothetical protein